MDGTSEVAIAGRMREQQSGRIATSAVALIPQIRSNAFGTAWWIAGETERRALDCVVYLLGSRVGDRVPMLSRPVPGRKSHRPAAAAPHI